MLIRLRRAVSVLAIVIASFAAYQLLVVPYVEPQVQRRESKSTPAAPPSSHHHRFDDLFAPGSWELNRPKVVETEQGTLLFADYKPLADGRMELTKCTVIAHLERKPATNSADATAKQEASSRLPMQRERRPLIMRAPQGATLIFDQPLNVLRGEFGRLVGGQLSGEVTIHSPASSPTSDDRLEIVTRNVQIEMQKIWTPHEVRFRYGPNSGRGSFLSIHLSSTRQLPGAGKSASEPGGLGITGVRSVELEHLESMDLLLANHGLFERQPDNRAAPAGPPTRHTPTPVHVTCRGPLDFNLVGQLVSLSDQVELTHLQVNGLRDRLACDRLEIYFSGGDQLSDMKSTSPGRPSSLPAGKLAATRVVATGNPVIMQAASAGVGARAEMIEYDFILGRAWLRDSQKVMFHDRQREVEASDLQYTPGAGNRLGELRALGPGVLRGEFGDSAHRYEVAWQAEIHLRRIENEPVLSCNARTKITVAGMGSFAGDALHLFLREKRIANTTDRVEILPDRLHVLGNVEADSDLWQAQLEEVKVWFRPPQPGQTSSGEPNRATGDRGIQPAGFAASATSGAAEQPRSRFELRAETMEAVVLMGQQPAADLVIVRKGVQLREIAPAETLPLLLQGDHFELQDGASAHPRAALLGAPAQCSARGMAAQGPKFHLHPSDNFLEIIGPGNLRMIDPEQPFRPPGMPPRAAVDWIGKMQFDGRFARFERNVTVRGNQLGKQGDATHYVATGDAIYGELTERVDFQNPAPSHRAELAEVAFDGWGFLQVETKDAAGERKLFQQMQVLQLRVNQQTGEIRGHGPGWLRGTHRGRHLAAAPPGQPAAAAMPAAGLGFLRVDFDREIAGNLHQQRIEFLNGTRTVYGPVASWTDALDQDQVKLPPRSIRMNCDRLSVSQFGAAAGEAVELEALGNASIHGEGFTASGGRISYVKLKDQVILEGDGRNDARIQFPPQPGARPSHFAADKILYWPSTGQFQVVGLKPSELNGLGHLGRGSLPAVRSP